MNLEEDKRQYSWCTVCGTIVLDYIPEYDWSTKPIPINPPICKKCKEKQYDI